MSRPTQVCDALPQPRGSVVRLFSQFSWTSLWYWVERVIEVRRQRRALMALDDRMLKDIGLTRSEAWREANRSPIDLPRHIDRPFRWR